jgi:hypothetical protein
MSPARERAELSAREFARLTAEQQDAVRRVVAEARRAPGQHTEQGDGWDVYAYALRSGCIAWGANAPVNFARGLFERSDQ